MAQSLLNLAFLHRRRVPVILQSEAAECGLVCLAMVAGFHGFRTDLNSLRRRWQLSLKGITLAQLIGMAEQLHLVPRALRVELPDLPRLRLPAILHWELDHFVVLERATADEIHVVDPSFGRRRMSMGEASRRFTGVCLELHPAAKFERKRERLRLPLVNFFRGVHGLPAALLKVALLSCSLQVLLLILPLFGQIVIDEIVLSDDRDLLTVLGLAFLLVLGTQVCLSGIRGWLVATLGATLRFGWGGRLFHHLMRLPLAWFEKRHMGDIASRFDSIRTIETLVARTAVEAVVDGLMTLTTAVVMLFYSLYLTAIVLVAVVLYAAFRLALFKALRLATFESVVLGGKADSIFMESIRAILPIKNYGREGIREAVWQGRRADAFNAEMRAQRLELIQQLANMLLFGVENIAVLWLGAIAILDGVISVGMLVAFIAYKSQFETRAAALVDECLAFMLVDVHLERLADIALAEKDPGVSAGVHLPRAIRGSLEARNLWFRYADTEPYVLRGVELRVEVGECVAITGQSGVGKTTLLKILTGLLQPTAGQILIDNLVLRHSDASAYRSQIAVVMQDDVLLSGSLVENISFFDAAPDQGRVKVCAQLAAIHDDIVQMPMGYLTRVGDMGSALSGGQRQRICLARALYARPRILFLDEATSHLDAFTENRIHQALRELKITRIIVAHRRETLAIADRIIQIPSASTASVMQPFSVWET